MPGPVDQVYALTPRDSAGALWGFHHRKIERSAAATTRFIGFTDFAAEAPPVGTVLYVTRIFVLADAGAAQNVTELIVAVCDQADNILTRLWESPVTEGFKRAFMDSDIPLLIGSQGLQVFASYDAGVAANALRLHWTGYVMPRGNVVAF